MGVTGMKLLGRGRKLFTIAQEVDALVSLGSISFGLLTYFCRGLNFYGNNGCWSEGQAQYFWLGVLSAFGLGIGFSILLYRLVRSIRIRNLPENGTQTSVIV